MTPWFCPLVATAFSSVLNPQPPLSVSPGSALADVIGVTNAMTLAARAPSAAFFAVFTAPPPVVPRLPRQTQDRNLGTHLHYWLEERLLTKKFDKLRRMSELRALRRRRQ